MYAVVAYKTPVYSSLRRFVESFSTERKMPLSIGMTLLHEEVTERIIRIFYAVYNELGYGFLEKVCQRAMVISLAEAGLAVEENVRFEVWFRGQLIGEFIADIV